MINLWLAAGSLILAGAGGLALPVLRGWQRVGIPLLILAGVLAGSIR